MELQELRERIREWRLRTGKAEVPPAVARQSPAPEPARPAEPPRRVERPAAEAGVQVGRPVDVGGDEAVDPTVETPIPPQSQAAAAGRPRPRAQGTPIPVDVDIDQGPTPAQREAQRMGVVLDPPEGESTAEIIAPEDAQGDDFE